MNGHPAERLTRLGLWWSRLVAMTVKELIQLGRDTLLLFAIAYLFIFDVYMAGNVSMQLNSALVVVHDADHSASSRELVYAFREPHFRLGGEVLDNRAGQRLLDQGQALMALSIPPNFERDILKGDQVDVQAQVDASNTVLGFLASSYTSQIIGRFSFERALERLGLSERSLRNVPMINDQHRIWYNPNQEDAWFMPISELLTVITIMAIMLPAAAAVREKERGTIEQLLVSPLTPLQIMLPKVLSMTLVILLGAAVGLFVVLQGMFGVPMKGSLGLFFALTTLYTVTTAGLGLYIATLSRNLAQAALLVILVLMPMLFLSGAWTPPEAMPYGMRLAMYVSPLYYFIEMGYAIMLKGAGLDVLWDSLLGLALLGLAILGFGVWRFERQFK